MKRFALRRLTSKRRAFPVLRVLTSFVVSICAASVLSGCADLPRDQHGATSRIQESRVLTVGIPGEQSDSQVVRREREILQRVAKRLGAEIKYEKGNAHELLENLEKLKLAVVAAALPSDSPFSASVAMSQPYWKNGPERKDYCIAVAPGENSLLFIIDQVILEEQKSQSAKASQRRPVSTRIRGDA